MQTVKEHCAQLCSQQLFELHNIQRNALRQLFTDRRLLFRSVLRCVGSGTAVP